MAIETIFKMKGHNWSKLVLHNGSRTEKIFSSQTSKNRLERSKTIENDFTLNHSEEIENKHILLIDDVITTGATIEACCKELLKTPNLSISVLSIAFTAHT